MSGHVGRAPIGGPRVVGVVGAGQLGRMLHQASIGLGIDLRFLAERHDDPAAQVAPQSWIGSAMSLTDLVSFAEGCDVMTFEHEIVALDALASVSCPVRPGARALAAVADKLAMRTAVDAAKVPAPAWRPATSVDEVAAAANEWSSIVVKLSRGGFDGRGVFVDPGRPLVAELVASGVPLLVEPVVPFRRELAVLVARRPTGDMVIYDPVVTVQHAGQCAELRAGALAAEPGGAATSAAAQSIASALADSLDVVGLLAVELFELPDGQLLVNELAVRPHNSGHHTIDACGTSQFENHLRAVCDLPLGPTTMRTPAVMVNVVGNGEGDDPRRFVAEALRADPAARVHLYGKQPRPNRKVGHVTVCDDDLERAAARAWRVVDALHGSLDARPQGTQR